MLSKCNKPWVSSAIRKPNHRKNSLYRNYINIINTGYNYEQTCTDIVDKNELATDTNIIPNTFNKYFCNIGSNLAKKISEENNENVTTNIKGLQCLFLKLRQMKLLLLSTS